MTHIEIASCEDAGTIKTNQSSLRYVTDCKAFLNDEWRMGFWQWVEDTIEFKLRIPEIEEEDAPHPPQRSNSIRP